MKKVSITFLTLALLIIPATTVSAVTDENFSLMKQQKSNDIDYADLIEVKDVDFFLQKADEFVSKHPKATHDETNDYLRKEMENYYKHKIETGTAGTMDYPIPTVESHLNPLEKELYNQDPLYGLRCMSVGSIAISEASLRYTQLSLTQGNGDAFRHAFWNAMMLLSTNKDFATKWATAHEDGDASNTYQNKTMDLTNNYRGRQIGEANIVMPSAFRNVLAPKVVEWVDAGKMVRIVNYEIVSTNSSEKL